MEYMLDHRFDDAQQRVVALELGSTTTWQQMRLSGPQKYLVRSTFIAKTVIHLSMKTRHWPVRISWYVSICFAYTSLHTLLYLSEIGCCTSAGTYLVS
ncbi:hypothetical protein BDV37DRAFT_259745 [Aspergillus pseudonomiae]|uniref:Uncharacterized protein n=1 Tax=Aspergillus pseudonomiae TaxID=1506151 RepID=A0A5N7D1I9_9EURO|nr:uncharacterized protein BDV37DRAFT_259745 [Aspergillus pseudonomiae]KAE8399698.1 hypothetical protein BDV37DRAFT_259745 [Aspergillus pseudonomiae]